MPSRPFRSAFDRHEKLVAGGLQLKVCPRVHFKAVLIDGAWLYLGSANLTGAGLGAKSDGRRNFEIGFATEDFEIIDRTRALFESVWSGAECSTCQLRAVCPDPIGEAAPRSIPTGGSKLGATQPARQHQTLMRLLDEGWVRREGAAVGPTGALA